MDKKNRNSDGKDSEDADSVEQSEEPEKPAVDESDEDSDEVEEESYDDEDERLSREEKKTFGRVTMYDDFLDEKTRKEIDRQTDIGHKSQISGSDALRGDQDKGNSEIGIQEQINNAVHSPSKLRNQRPKT